MGTTERRERDRAKRRRTILAAARDLAEAEGWGAVTTRRLSERIEYSQPVLYSHFAGRTAIVGAVAEEGFAELSARLRSAGDTGADPLAGVARAYLAFAREHPATYEAMFAADTDLVFASDDDTPPALLAGFAALRDPLAAVAGDTDADTRTEVFWSALHGMAELTRASRMRPEHEEARLDLLLRAVQRD